MLICQCPRSTLQHFIATLQRGSVDVCRSVTSQIRNMGIGAGARCWSTGPPERNSSKYHSVAGTQIRIEASMSELLRKNMNMIWNVLSQKLD